jgi:hypothetical protein
MAYRFRFISLVRKVLFVLQQRVTLKCELYALLFVRLNTLSLFV